MRTLLLLTLLALTGCEYHTKTERRIAFFRKGENNGETYKSRDIGSFVQDRQGNKTDEMLRKFFDTSPRK